MKVTQVGITKHEGLISPNYAIIVDMTIVNEVGDDLTVSFNYMSAGNDFDGILYWDIETSTSNGDWASPRKQHEALGLAIERFYADGFDTRFGVMTDC